VLQSSSRCVRWLRGQLPALVSAGVITPDASKAIEQHYAAEDSRSRNIGIVLLAIVGSALVAAGIILLIAHNWDDFSRPTRSIIAFLPLIVAQAVAIFVLMRRDESQASRESVAIFEVAAVATAISLVSQTYQIQGTFADFMRLWLLLSIPVVYIFRSSFGAAAYIIGTVVWLFSKGIWPHDDPAHLFFWLFLLAIVPYYAALLRRDRASREVTLLSILLLAALGIGLEFAVESTRGNLGGIAYAGLFTLAYLCGIRFFQREENRLPALALLGGIGISVMAILLSFEWMWHMTTDSSQTLAGPARGVAIAIQLLFPAAAIGILVWDYLQRHRITFSIAAVALPLVAGLAWMIANLAPATQRAQDTSYSLVAALIFDIYALLLGIELLMRGVRANGLARANFGLLIIAALAIARFFDTDLTFVTRGLGFIVVGVGFLAANVLIFKKRGTA
jgi:uncharacterized membrane protein